MKVSLKFESSSAMKALETLPMKLRGKIMVEALTDAAEPMRLRMSQLAPRLPPQPDMADHIIVRPVKAKRNDETPNASLTDMAVAIGPEKRFFYAKFQEFGTVRHGAKPFMRPAFDGESVRALTLLAQKVWAILTAKGLAPTSRGGGGSRGGI